VGVEVDADRRDPFARRHELLDDPVADAADAADHDVVAPRRGEVHRPMVPGSGVGRVNARHRLTSSTS